MSNSYPLPGGESLQAWRGRRDQARALLAVRGLLRDVDARGGALAGTLEALERGPVAPGLLESPGRERLVGELVLNLADPGRINQGLKGTCAAACVERHLAVSAPAEYGRLIFGLAAPPGEVALRGGGLLVRDERSLRWAPGEAARSPVSRLLQAAAMEFAYPELDYRNLEDGYLDPRGRRLASGLGLDAFDRLLEAATGQRWDTLSDRQAHLRRLLEKAGFDTSAVPRLERDGPSILRRSLAANQPVFVTLDPPRRDADPLLTLPHKVIARRQGRGRLYYDDPLSPLRPWLPGADARPEGPGGRWSLPLEGFMALAVELSYQPAFFTSPD